MSTCFVPETDLDLRHTAMLALGELCSDPGRQGSAPMSPGRHKVEVMRGVLGALGAREGARDFLEPQSTLSTSTHVMWRLEER